MAEPPSEPLVRALYGLNLCTAGDLRRCRGRVRQLTSDLPAFDSVWIDALQRTGRLTPFQAGMLDAGEAEGMSVGPCVLVDRLGPARTGRTFVARHRDTGEHCVLKILGAEGGTARDVDRRTRALVDRTRLVEHPAVVAPRTIHEHAGGLVAVSNWIDGPSCEELLVRRGRFPARVVLAAARQLAEGLVELESRQLLHGDLRTTNVRVTKTGRMVAVDAGIRAALEPEVRTRETDGPERFDGTAPERVGNGRPADTASEVYAFGCLLWTLLAGRPPFPTGDVLGKLTAHASRELEDVGEIAPDTPTGLVRLVGETTARDPSRRPRSFGDVLATLGRSTAADRSVLASFHGSFERSVPSLPRSAGEGNGASWQAVAALILVVGIVGTLLVVDDWRNAVGSFATRTVASVGSLLTREPTVTQPPKEGGTTTPDDGRLALPKPDVEGLVLLTSDGPYRASQLSAIGPLTLRGANGTRPVIVVDDEPLEIWAEELTIENVELRSTSRNFGALALLRCQRLEVSESRFVEGSTGNGLDPATKPTEPRYALAWRPLDPKDATGGALVLRDTVFLGGHTALFAAVSPRELVVENVLKAGAGSLVAVATNPAPGADTTFRLTNVTLRAATHLVRGDRKRAEAGVTWIEAADCVFDLTGPRAALLAWFVSPDDVPDRVQFDARSSVTSPNVPTATLTRPDGTTFDASEHGNVIVEGLTANRVVFAGSLDDPRGSVVERFEGPRITGGEHPGIRVDRLTVQPSSTTRVE